MRVLPQSSSTALARIIDCAPTGCLQIGSDDRRTSWFCVDAGAPPRFLPLHQRSLMWRKGQAAEHIGLRPTDLGTSRCPLARSQSCILASLPSKRWEGQNSESFGPLALDKDEAPLLAVGGEARVRL